MKLGIYLNSQHRERDDPARRLAETLEQRRLIRSLGFDSIWAGEHHLVPDFHYFPQLPPFERNNWRQHSRIFASLHLGYGHCEPLSEGHPSTLAGPLPCRGA